MPFYEYQCKSCGHELEAMQKVSDAPLKKCPHCGKSQLTRLMSAPVFRLKGGGWYETDFKGDKDNQRNLADRPDDAPKDAKDTDTKAKDEKGKDGKDAKAAETKPDALRKGVTQGCGEAGRQARRFGLRAAPRRNRLRARAGRGARRVPNANPLKVKRRR